MADPQVNFFRSTLVGTYSDTDTSITIATGDGALLPDPSVDGAFNLTIFEGLQVTGSTEFEIVRVTARSGDVLTVTRGEESTTPLTIGSATHSILMSATKKTFDDINDAIENVDLTTLTNVEELTFDNTGDEEFGLPAGTTAQRPSSPSAGYSRYNTETAKLEIYSGGVWGLVSLENVRVMQTAQLSVTANDAVAENIIPLEVEYLVIAGGGGGGARSQAGGAGGAGGYRSSVSGESSGGGASAESPLELDLSTNYTVTVGAGGAGAPESPVQGSDGADSEFSTINSVGGGGGGGSTNTEQDGAGRDGGSGGGGGQGSSSGSLATGGSGTANQGFDGGSAFPLQNESGASNRAGGGGGGAGGVGGDASSDTSGSRGAGVSSSVTGVSVTYARGGLGGSVSNDGGSGLSNLGEGGNGSGGIQNSEGGNGGSGVVILRYPSNFTISIGAGLTGTETTDGNEKYAEITAGTGNVSWTQA